jgi:hypothetical protein
MSLLQRLLFEERLCDTRSLRISIAQGFPTSVYKSRLPWRATEMFSKGSRSRVMIPPVFTASSAALRRWNTTTHCVKRGPATGKLPSQVGSYLFDLFHHLNMHSQGARQQSSANTAPQLHACKQFLVHVCTDNHATDGPGNGLTSEETIAVI